ncbi:type II toxin-antitoxin system HicA family toxin [Candidatus Microgenomates bacterium]|nr:type II toxin-antitoxin system HicA family toxin [Candidatus Microgenomates bacterium]
MLPHDLPSDISQKRLARAFVKMGFILDMSGGKGGHYKLTNPKNKQFITLQSKIYKEVLRDKLKQAEGWGYDAEEIMRNY